MTRKNSTVNPKAGTLKQENRALRTNMRTITVKLIAFALFILVSIPNMSFVQEDAIVAAADSKQAIQLLDMNPDSCCMVEKPGINGKGKTMVKLVIPSIEMIRKSDSEATSNLVYSLKENKLNALKKQIMKSDAEITTLFSKETSLARQNQPGLMQADTHMNVLFAAETIHSVKANNLSDEEIDNLFTLENKGIPVIYTAIEKADAEIGKDFVMNTLNIALPSVNQFLLADIEISGQIQNILDREAVAFAKSSN